jgi:hypothetical protein
MLGLRFRFGFILGLGLGVRHPCEAFDLCAASVRVRKGGAMEGGRGGRMGGGEEARKRQGQRRKMRVVGGGEKGTGFVTIACFHVVDRCCYLYMCTQAT